MCEWWTWGGRGKRGGGVRERRRTAERGEETRGLECDCSRGG